MFWSLIFLFTQITYKSRMLLTTVDEVDAVNVEVVIHRHKLLVDVEIPLSDRRNVQTQSRLKPL